MGEVEKCPKCGMRLRFNKAEYRTAEGGVLPESYSCIICGYFRDVYTKPVLDFDGSMKQNKYPEIRKTLGDTGWLRKLVKEHFEKLESLRKAHNSTWYWIQGQISISEPLFKHTTNKALSTAYHRVRRERQEGPPLE